MKRTCAVLLPAFVLAATTIPNFSRAQNDGYAVTARGANYSILQKTTVENGTNRIHQYTELATGLNYTNSYGQLVESEEQIDILPNGGAAAVQGQHQVYFPADIADGVLEVVTPDGRHLQSRPLGVSYDDGSNTVFIATLTNAVGWLTASNQVTYRNCFSGIDADLVCTYRRSGFECDLVFRRQPPAPDQYGLDDSSSTLQLVTEFFNTQDPQEIPAAYDEWYGLQDDTLKFGKLTMKQGRAFAVGGSGSNSAQNSRSRFTSAATSSVYKRWLHLAGRTFLIEEVPLEYLADDLNTLPPETNALTSKVTGRLRMASNHLKMPPSHEFVSGTGKIQIAANGLKRQPGVVLDYDEIDSATNDFTFQSGTTYYLSDVIDCGGTTTFEGGAVIKGAEMDFDFCTNFVCSTDRDNPTIFTSPNDNSVGDPIADSTGLPAPGEGIFLSGVPDGSTIRNMRFYYSSCGVESWAASCDIWDCQFINFQTCGVLKDGSGGNWLGLHNVLFAQDSLTFDLNCAVQVYGDTIVAEHVTVDRLPSFIESDGLSVAQVFITNSLITGSPAIASGSSCYTNHVVFLPSPTTSIYQTADNGNYYLATNSPYRNVGTTAIDPGLLAELQTMTTYAPQDGNWPDNDGLPDLGYHYPETDSDQDGLPDWWEYYWFGNLTHTGSELDANGNTLLYDYQSYLDGAPVDPNPIVFNISVANNYVSTSYPALQMNVTAGTPYYYTVQLDNTNFMAATNWTAYTSSSLTANLGTTEGWHELWIGLKGYATNSTMAWQWKRLKYDVTPSVLVITGPTNGTVTQPMIQLTGYSPEDLGSYSYDLSNAVTVVTNQQVLVLNRYHDTNTWEFTTNTFQAFDIPLTNGVNQITLHATDLAGNATTLVTNFTLDYSTVTNPPVVQIAWPQNGAQLSGGSFTLDGQLDDPTAGVSVSITDTNGDTNVVNGSVGRDGKFVVDGIPLNAGTNLLTLTVTNAAGLSSVTNFSYVQSPLVLTITPLADPTQLWQPTVTLTGTISDATYAVWANGVKGTNYGSTWEVDNVPTKVNGVVRFNVTAYAPTEQQPDGSYGQ